MYYVYRFLDKFDNIIYVGKSKQELDQRFYAHTHLPDECYSLTHKIEYIECSTESDMSIKEIYYINKYRSNHVFFNVLDATETPTSVSFEDKWKVYQGPLDSQFFNTVNYIQGFTRKKHIKYNKDGTICKIKPNKIRGIESFVDAFECDEVDLIVNYLINRINNAEDLNKEQIWFRNLVMFVLGVNIPHKASDFLQFKYKDIFDKNDKPKAVVLQLGRFGKDEIIKIPLKDVVIKLLTAYVQKYGLTYETNSEDHLFQSRKHQIVSARSWWRILTEATESVGIEKNIGAESIRKTYGLNIYDRSPNKLSALLFLGELWGHTREAKIIKYLNLTDNDIDFDYYLGETFSLCNVDFSKISCI